MNAHLASQPSNVQQDEVNSNQEYLRCVNRLAQRTDITAERDIHASNGMKLLAKGSRIDPHTWGKLGQHALGMPLETVLVAADTLDVVMLARDADRIMATEPALASLANRTGDSLGWKAALGKLELPAPLAFRLTVLRDQKEEMYHHAVRMALIAHCIGARLRWSERQQAQLLLAALCHDLGEMHTDPALLHAERALAGDELRFIHVHPVTGYVILSQISGVPKPVAQAVLQHHERMDGSGYPHGIAGAAIHPLARVLAVAELYDVVARRGGVERLDIVLRVEQAQFDGAVVQAMRTLLPVSPARQELPMEEALPALMPRLERLIVLTKAWEILQPGLQASAEADSLRFMQERVEQLQVVAWRAGIAPGFLEMFQPDEADAQSIRELHVTLDEMDRLLTALAAEIRRRISSGSPHWAELDAFCEKLTGAKADAPALKTETVDG